MEDFGKDFYNKDNKLAFLEENGKMDDYNTYSIFSSIGLYEQGCDTDVCNFAKNRILSMYTFLASTSADRLNNITSTLRTYTNWCLTNELVIDGQNHFNEIDYDDLLLCINKSSTENKYITRRNLINWANGNKMDGVIVNPCDLGVIWLLFEGVRGTRYKEIFEVAYSDINADKCTIRLPERELTLSKECIDFLIASSEVKQYVSSSTRSYNFIDDKIYRSYKKNQLDRESKDPKVAVNQLYLRITKAMRELGVENSSLNSAIISGQIDFIKRKAKEKNVAVSDYIRTMECNHEVVERFGTKTFVGRRFYAMHMEQFGKED